MRNRAISLRAAALAVAAALAFGAAQAQQKPEGKPVHPGTPKEDLMYRGAPVPIQPGQAPETVSPKAPLTVPPKRTPPAVALATTLPVSTTASL